MRYPLVTLKVIMLIHWHALLLWAKRVPWFAKAALANERAGGSRKVDVWLESPPQF